jgi:hypothetical protein
MIAGARWPDRFDREDNHAAGPRSPLENLSAGFTPGHSFSKDRTPDTLAAIIADISSRDYARLAREAYLDTLPGFVQLDPERVAAKLRALGEFGLKAGSIFSEPDTPRPPRTAPIPDLEYFTEHSVGDRLADAFEAPPEYLIAGADRNDQPPVADQPTTPDQPGEPPQSAK